jgi:hypothetical protein
MPLKSSVVMEVIMVQGLFWSPELVYTHPMIMFTQTSTFYFSFKSSYFSEATEKLILLKEHWVTRLYIFSKSSKKKRKKTVTDKPINYLLI